MTYHKIQSLFKRDSQGKFTPEFSLPEFELLQDIEWEWTEKIDGTNIRIEYIYPDGVSPARRIGGRTDRAQVPTHLLAKLEELFPLYKLIEVFDNNQGVVLYGEGIGPKIQKVGSLYRPDGPDFILFDVKIGRWWLKRDDVEVIGKALGVKVAPVLGTGCLAEAEMFVEHDFYSGISQTPYTPAEGLVLRPKLELFSRSGARIITKLKTRDYR